MWWILFSLVPALLSLFGCADNRPVEHQQKKKPQPASEKSTRSTKSTKSTKSATSKRRRRRRRKGKSMRSTKSGKGSAKSGRSSKKSTRSGMKSEKKSEATKAGKSLKSSKSSRSTDSKKPNRSSKSSKSRKSRKAPKEVEIKSVKPRILSKEEIVDCPIVKPMVEPVVEASRVKPPPAIVDVPVPASEPVATPCVTDNNCVKIRAEPVEMNFKPTGGLKEFKIVNDSDEKRVFKIKCTDNQLYRVSPVIGQIDPHQTVVVDILRQNGSIKVDKLVLVTAKAKENGKGGNFWGCQKTVVPLLVDV